MRQRGQRERAPIQRLHRLRRLAAGPTPRTWAPDGRATFSYGPERRAGDLHVTWRTIGDHSILLDP